jgi:hypothetical protein
LNWETSKETDGTINVKPYIQLKLSSMLTLINVFMHSNVTNIQFSFMRTRRIFFQAVYFYSHQEENSFLKRLQRHKLDLIMCTLKFRMSCDKCPKSVRWGFNGRRNGYCRHCCCCCHNDLSYCHNIQPRSFVIEFHSLHYEVMKHRSFNSGTNLFQRFARDKSGKQQVALPVGILWDPDILIDCYC